MHFNADRQFDLEVHEPNPSSPVVITRSRDHEMKGTLLHPSWTREHDFTTWMERSIITSRGALYLIDDAIVSNLILTTFSVV